MKKIAIFLNGEISDYNYVRRKLEEVDFIISVDGGNHHTDRLGIVPDLVLGDFDSYTLLDKTIQSKIYSSVKDFTDGEAAIEYVINQNPAKVLIFGALGNRMDHTLSNIYMLEKLADNDIQGEILSLKNEIYFLQDALTLEGVSDEFFSIVAITEVVRGIDIINAKYELDKATLSRTSSLGISNEFIDGPAIIKIESGKALVLKTKD